MPVEPRQTDRRRTKLYIRGDFYVYQLSENSMLFCKIGHKNCPEETRKVCNYLYDQNFLTCTACGAQCSIEDSMFLSKARNLLEVVYDDRSI